MYFLIIFTKRQYTVDMQEYIIYIISKGRKKVNRSIEIRQFVQKKEETTYLLWRSDYELWKYFTNSKWLRNFYTK